MLLKRYFIVTLLLLAYSAGAARIDTLIVTSSSMNKKIPNLIILPKSYSYSKQDFPVVYLLHGAGDNYLGWLEIAPELKDYADQYNMILVCPDGGSTSWYFDSPVDKTMRYETYITKELIAIIDIKYRTIHAKNGRAITGLSMGGHGAFYLSFRNPQLWGAAGSTSGGLDIRPFSTKWELPKRLGTIEANPETWNKHSVINLIPLIKDKSLRIIFDCGKEDFFYSVNMLVHLKMQDLKIDHNFYPKPGGHAPAYWRSSIKSHLQFFKDYFSQQNFATTPVE